MPYALDTSFLIDLAQGQAGARSLVEEIDRSGETMIAPTVVVAEFLGGVKDPESQLRALEKAVEVLPFSVDDAVAAARIGAERLAAGDFPGWLDACIMGFAANRSATLITADERMRDVPTRTYRP